MLLLGCLAVKAKELRDVEVHFRYRPVLVRSFLSLVSK